MKQTKKILLIMAMLIAMTVCFAFGASAEEFTEGDYTCSVENGEATIIAYNGQGGDVVIPGTLGGYKVVSLGESLFEGCETLESIVIPDGVKTLGVGAFAYCGNLKNLTISDSVTTISSDCFYECYSLETISIPESVTTIGEGCFYRCFSLETAQLSSNADIGSSAFEWCVGLKNVYIPEGVSVISDKAFLYCFSLEKIVIPASVKEIGSHAFSDCFNLNNVYVLSKDVQLGDYSLLLVDYDIDTSIMSRKEYAEKWKSMAKLETEEEINDLFNELNDSIIYDFDYSYLQDATIHAHEGSTAETYAKENGIDFAELTDDITVTDEKTNITAEYTADIFDATPDMVIIEGGANANITLGGLFGKFTSFDITFEIDGKEVQPMGKVTIKIPLPAGYNSRTTKVYYIDDLGRKTVLESTYADGYVIFETDHFSEYALVDESSAIENEPTEDDKTDDCTCMCHKGGFMKFIYKIMRFFWKLFKTNAVCGCGVAHY